MSTVPNHYKYTYVDTGTAAPTSALIGIRLDEPLDFNSSVGSDLYIMAVGGVGEIQEYHAQLWQNRVEVML